MLLDLVQFKKNIITVSSENTPTSLVNFHTAKSTFQWTPGSSDDPAWIKINLYKLTDIQSIDITFTGACTEMKVEYSIDNITWHTLTDVFTPDATTGVVEIDYSDDPVDASFVRVFCGGLTTFVMTEFVVRSDIDFQNEEFLSHFSTSLYAEKEIEDYPWIPSFSKSFLEMLENKETKDLKLFDSTDYSSTSLAKNVSGYDVDLTASDVPLDAVIYYWDWDEQITTVTFDKTGAYYDYNGAGYYWTIDMNTTETDYYVWYNVTDGSNTQTDPAVTGKTGVQVDILSADTSTNIATKTTTLVNALSLVNASSASAVMTMTNALPSVRATSADYNTTATIAARENLIQTLNPLTQVSNTYQHAGSYIPKIVMNYLNFQLEFSTDVTVT